jgi:CRP/FNR family transcriptional regulator
MESMSLSGRVRGSVLRGPLRSLSPQSIERLVSAGVLVHLDEGHKQPSWQTDPTMVVDGLLRLWTRTPEGREWTVRYLEVGATAHFVAPSAGEANPQFQAMTDSSLLVLDRAVLRRWASVDATFALAVSDATASECAGITAEVTATMLRPLRTRICHHLLFLAERLPARDGRLPITHLDLASAVGSVRDVVTRILDDLEDAGTIELRRGVIVVHDRAHLRAISRAPDKEVVRPRTRLTVTSVT